jgi:hypothetical protein
MRPTADQDDELGAAEAPDRVDVAQRNESGEVMRALDSFARAAPIDAPGCARTSIG